MSDTDYVLSWKISSPEGNVHTYVCAWMAGPGRVAECKSGVMP